MMPELKNSISEGDLVAGNYRILGVAGSGGMGVVYRARDLRLERVVALKFLPSELNASQRDKERFLREARTASSLDHPNIGVIHGVEETADERTFIVMAFYEGTSLSQRIRNGPIPAGEAIPIASQVARGLGEAHSRGIVHRDIKPSNVMVTGSGLVKIVDFGLAYAANAQSTTQSGISGTVAYMAPEQAMGYRVDHRCDIWALGVVMVEMLTADSPFHSDSSHSVLAAILNSPPENIDRIHSALQPVLYRALAKEPDRRYQSCGELLSDLERVAREIPAADNGSGKTPSYALPTVRFDAVTRRAREDASRSVLSPVPARRSRFVPALLGVAALVALLVVVVLLVPSWRKRAGGLVTGAPPQEHVAVLPFDNIGSNPENTVLAEGLMDSLAGRLSNLDVGNQSLWVVPTSMVRRLKVTDPEDALKELGANLVVKGSIERDGSDIRLNVNLIDTKNMRQVGSADVDDRAGDLSTLEDETIARLASLMNISVTADMLRNTGGRVDPAAYEDYLKALGYIDRYDKPGNLEAAIAGLKQATQTDPNFALGYASLAEAYRLQYEVTKDRKWLAEGEAEAQKAAEIDSNIPAIYVTLGNIHNMTGKHDLAVQEFQHALQVDPRDAEAESGLATAYENAGSIKEAEAAYQKAAALRPDAWMGYERLGAFYDRQNMYPQAVSADQHAIQLTPDNAQVYSNLGGACVDSADPKLLPIGEQALRKSIQLGPSYPAYNNLGNLLLLEHRGADAEAALKLALKINAGDYNTWNSLMMAYEWQKKDADASGARHRAIALAEQAVKLQPTDAFAQSSLAYLYAEDKQNEKSRIRIQAALALSPNDPNVLCNVAQAFQNMDDRAQAMEYIGKALRKGYPLAQVQSEPTLQALLHDPSFHLPRK